MKIPKIRFTILTIVVGYFTISCLYFIFSDMLLHYLFRDDSSSALFYEIQTYKDVGFVLLTSIILVLVFWKGNAVVIDSLDELENAQKKIRKSLKKVALSEFLSKEVSLMARIGAYEFFIENNRYYFSDEVFYIFNLSREEISSEEAMLKILGDKLHPELEEAINKCMTKGQSFDLEFEIVFIEKPNVWLRVVVEPIYNESNKIIGRRGVLQDITKQKNKEIEYLRSEHLLNQTARSSKIGGWSVDLRTMESYFTEETFNIYGILNGQTPTVEEGMSYYPPESFLIIKKAFEEAVKGIAYDIEVPFLKRKSEKIWVRTIGVPTIENGKVVFLTGTIQDITEIKAAEERLLKIRKKVEESERKLLMSQEVSKLGHYELNLETGTWTNSEEINKIWGIDAGYERTIDGWLDIVHPDFQSEMKAYFLTHIMQNKNKFDKEYKIINKKTKQELWVHGLGELKLDSANKPIEMFGTIQDVNQKKKIEDMYRLLADHSNDIICLHEPDSTFKYISPSMKNLLGYSPSEFLGKQIFSITHKDDVLLLKKAIKERVFKGLIKGAFSYRVRHKEGHFIWLESLGSPIIINDKISSFVTSSRDVTKSVKAKEEIEQNQTALQKLTTEITLIEEKQKREIATNIHDHLSQSLVISKMKLNQLKKRPELKMIDEDLQFIETQISQALDNSRKITYELSPPALYQLGIVDALNWLLEDIKITHNINYQMNDNSNDVKLDDGKSILLYRTIQEVLTNVIKYANASLIIIDIDNSSQGIEVVVTDNGDGFDTSTLDFYIYNHINSGFGLFTIKQRIKNIQGEFTITSEIAVGTTVKTFIPLSI